MSFDRQSTIARDAVTRAAALGFDHLVVKAVACKTFAVRIAQSAICRENVARAETSFHVTGMWQGREAQLQVAALDASELLARLATLRQDLEAQAPDLESVLPLTPSGRIQWNLARSPFSELYAPETVYPAIAAHAARVRAQGLRLTGYLEAMETLSHGFATSQTRRDLFELETHDHGVTLTMTVDDEKSGAVGASQRASTHAEPDALGKLVGDAVDEAMLTATTSRQPGELSPGKYTVILHPAAAADLIGTALGYGLFDRRKIDEGRTYLSGRHGDLSFPKDLNLAQTLSLPLPDGGLYADCPLNHRGVLCESLNLIDHGRLKDLHTTPYWAKASGHRETFAPSAAPPLILTATSAKGTLADLIGATERGVYIANTWYLRMVSEMDGVITGMTRDGLYEIEGGKLKRPLLNMRWHDNPIRVLQAIDGVTRETVLLGRSRLAGRGRTVLMAMPAVRVKNFHFSSVTKF